MHASLGDLLQTAVFHFRRLDSNHWGPDKRAEEILQTLASKALDSPFVIAVGNGTASREVQLFIASLIKRNVISAKFWLVISVFAPNCFMF